MNILPYLFFDGRAEEAIEFYKKALGAEVTMLMRFKDSPEPHDPERLPAGNENKVMHASLKIGGATVLLSDGHCQGAQKFEGFGLNLNVSSDAEAARLFAAVSEGGQVAMPLGKTFYASSFGMVTDRFGVLWMIMKDA